MKTLKFFLIGLLVVMTLSACNKDIPKNIPEWLKTKIKEIKKEMRKENEESGSRWIAEFSNDSTTIYQYNPNVYASFGYSGTYIFDKDGNELCWFEPAISTAPCASFSYHEIQFNFTKTRMIWMSK